MTTLADKAKAALDAGEPTCTKCGAPSSNHPYRHPFSPSHAAPDSLVFARAYLEVLEDRNRLREALEVYAEPCDATETTPCGYEGHMCCKTARVALKQEDEA